MWWGYKEEDKTGAGDYTDILNRIKAGGKEALDSYGAIAGQNKTLICYVTYFELAKLRENISLLEETAFITVSTVDEIIR